MSVIGIEVVGIVATLLICFSMCFKATSIKGNIWMRSINIAGSAVFMLYGVLLPAWSTAILNGILIIINICHLVILIRNK